MNEQEADALVQAYRKERWLYERLARLVGRYFAWRVADLFKDRPYEVLCRATDRAKGPRSLRDNLVADRYPGPVNSHRDVKDLAGARFIFQFRDDWLQFRARNSQLAQWFGHESVRRYKPRARGGYTADHFPVVVCKDTDFCRAMREQDRKDLEGLECEVQVRTALQDAWAEAEHPTHYKPKCTKDVEFPPDEDRSWETVSSALELADQALVQRKEACIKLAGPRKVLPTGLEWTYKDPPCPRAYPVGGVRYWYEVLHPVAENSTNEITIQKELTLFDVDKAMSDAGGPSQYKRTLWAQLQKSAREFLSTIPYDSLVVRAKEWDSEAAKLTVQPARYSDQVVTNHRKALEQDVPGGRRAGTVWAFGHDGGELLSFVASPLSNTLGIACMLRTTDGLWAIALRSRKVAFDPGKWGCTASGALEWSEPDLRDGKDLVWVKDAMARECEQELGFRPETSQIEYLAFAREIERAGKPQFFFLVEPPICRPSVEASWRLYADDEQEVAALLFLNDDQARILVGRNPASLEEDFQGAGLGEEPRMNLALALQYKGLI